jgi:hypothetical protein
MSCERKQENITTQGQAINPYKVWQTADTQKQLEQIKIVFINKLKAEWTEEMPAGTVRYRVICPCFAVNSIKIKCTECSVWV